MATYASGGTNYLFLGGPLGGQVVRLTIVGGVATSTESFQDTARA